MTRRDDRVSLRQMLDHAREAVALVAARSRGDLDSERVLSLALVQLAQIVGEAASRVSEDFRRQHSEIPWNEIVALRNRLVHGYDTVDFDILWQILQFDLPALVTALERIVADA